MALNTGVSYFSNSITGIPMAGVDVNVETVDLVPRYALGYLVARADGNLFRYSYINGALNSGNLVGPTLADGGAAYGAITVVASASAVVVPQEYPILAGQVGSHYIEATIASIAAHKYQGGYLMTTGGTGLGQTYRIVDNTATGTPASGNIRIQLAEALTVAVTPATGVVIVQSMFNDLAYCTTSATTATGVLMGTTSSTAGYYAWVCTHGPVGCLEDPTTNTPVSGAPLVCSINQAGAYQALTVAAATSLLPGLGAQPIIGYSLTVAGGTKNRQGAIFLTLE